MVLTPNDTPYTSHAFYITLGSWIEDTAHLAARLQLENGGLSGDFLLAPASHTSISGLFVNSVL